jgi:hypothetical protein
VSWARERGRATRRRAELDEGDGAEHDKPGVEQEAVRRGVRRGGGPGAALARLLMSVLPGDMGWTEKKRKFRPSLKFPFSVTRTR